MEFFVQAGSPEIRACGAVDDFAEAVSQIYWDAEEYAVLVWNWVPILLSYSDDISVMLHDLVPLLEEVQRPGFVGCRVQWGSNTFLAQWDFSRDRELLVIDASWQSTNGSYEHLLSNRPRVSMPIRVFVDEWSKILRQILADFDSMAVVIADHDILQRTRGLLFSVQYEGLS
ncbi:hypothetical protein [Nocardia sp. NPDC020380]|uniref:hypothetical protein n=1 Tax=Nocardia sp. NPDC020380 TaxID=3364309 RepID=UPI0037AFE920